jgi:RNA-splicing ligase RtcB
MIQELSDNKHSAGNKVRIMPDVHLGHGIVIGFTGLMGTHVSPSHIGLDIGCGIDTELFDRPLYPKDYALFEHRLKKEIPMGADINKKSQFEMKSLLKFMRQEVNRAFQSARGMINMVEFLNEDDLVAWMRSVNIQPAIFYKSLGTLGGGNHFMEYEEGEDRWAFTVHTGSRSLGTKVFNKWDRVAKCNGGYLAGEALKGYLTDMVITQAYAKYNRKLILDKATVIMHKINGAKVDGIIGTTHNYLDFQDLVIRKGAIRSYAGELVVIPFNMRDGIAIAEGLSNEDWNFSAPHGSGRVMSRTAARRNLTMKGFKLEMQGVYSTCITPDTIDESPSAYKPTEQILDAVSPTCRILYRLKAKINLKATNNGNL